MVSLRWAWHDGRCRPPLAKGATYVSRKRQWEHFCCSAGFRQRVRNQSVIVVGTRGRRSPCANFTLQFILIRNVKDSEDAGNGQCKHGHDRPSTCATTSKYVESRQQRAADQHSLGQLGKGWQHLLMTRIPALHTATLAD